jgi:hypothetical protein
MPVFLQRFLIVFSVVTYRGIIGNIKIFGACIGEIPLNAQKDEIKMRNKE